MAHELQEQVELPHGELDRVDTRRGVGAGPAGREHSHGEHQAEECQRCRLRHDDQVEGRHEQAAARAERQAGDVRELRAGIGAERPPAGTGVGPATPLLSNVMLVCGVAA